MTNVSETASGEDWPMQRFVHDTLPGRVVFGAGSLAEVANEAARMAAERVLVIATPSQSAAADRIARDLGPRCAARTDETAGHVPVELIDRARETAEKVSADLTLCVGGGAAIGLAKGLALRLDLPILAVPTTYSGSEMTNIWGVSEDGQKVTGRDPRVLPKTVVYDPELTVGLPARIGGPSGMNAIAHCVEALYADNASPVTTLMAEEGVRALARSLPRVIAQPDDMASRGEALYGAYMAGAALCVAAMGIHHKLCHVLGGVFALPHAETHTVLLPHATAFNAEAAPHAMSRIARAMAADSAAPALFDLTSTLGAPTALRDLGMKGADLDRAAEIATDTPYANPRPVDRDGVRALLEDAFHGVRPG